MNHSNPNEWLQSIRRTQSISLWWRHLACYVTLALCVLAYSAKSAIDWERVSTYRECADGWTSPSIGRQGACSHHGGVVTRISDRRGQREREVSNVCGAIALICLIIGGALVATWSHVPIPAITLSRNREIVPLTIAGETRLVQVKRVSDSSYKTVYSVAMVACPERRRRTVYKSRVEFVRRGNEKFHQNLSVWISTGRGHAGGYTAVAYGWVGEELADNDRSIDEDRTGSVSDDETGDEC